MVFTQARPDVYGKGRSAHGAKVCVVSRDPGFAIGDGPIDDFDAKAGGHGRSPDRSEPPPPNGARHEPHAPFSARRTELEPHKLVCRRQERSHVNSRTRDVVTKADLVFLATRSSESDGRSVEQARARAFVRPIAAGELVREK